MRYACDFAHPETGERRHVTVNFPGKADDLWARAKALKLMYGEVPFGFRHVGGVAVVPVN